MKMHCAILAVVGGLMPLPASALCNRDFSDPARLMVSLMRETGGRPTFEDAQFTSFNLPKEGSQFTFTKRGHPADPAVVCRYPEKVGEFYKIKIEASCAGPAAACEKLIADFKNLSEGTK